MPNKEKKIQLPALDSGDNNHINGIPAFRARNSDHDQISPEGPRGNHDMFHRHSRMTETVREEREYYMSEPSLSEDGASSSIYTPMSPINGGAIHMTHSPSNTSLSSLGSPGAGLSSNLSRKRMNFFTDKPSASSGHVLRPLEDQNEVQMTSDVVDKGISPISSNGSKPQSSSNEDKTSQGSEEYDDGEKRNPDQTDYYKLLDDDLSSSTNADSPSHDGVKNASLPSGLANSHLGSQTEHANEIETPDSQRYLTAIESSVDDDDSKDDSSDLSYDSSSSQEIRSKKIDTNSTQKSMSTGRNPNTPDADKHFLNDPLHLNYDTISPYGNEGDKASLLSNTDSKLMDTSSINTPGTGQTLSPEESISPGGSPNLAISTSPRVASYHYSEGEGSITPKRKTSEPSSANNSLSSSSDFDEKKLPSNFSLAIPEVEADDEGKPRERRKRLYSAEKRAPGHRRQRSGDDAAATLLTGSSEWVGMEMDKLPLPNEREADDEPEEDAEEPQDKESSERAGMNRKLQQRRRPRRPSFGKVTLGVKNVVSADDIHLLEKSPKVMEEGISTRFSPRVTAEAVEGVEPSPRTGLHRSLSFGEASASTAESQFSWISNRTTSVVSKETESGSSTLKGQLFADEFSASKSLYNGSRDVYDTTNMAGITPPIGNREYTNLNARESIAQRIPDFGRDIEMQMEESEKVEAYDAHIRGLGPQSPTRVQPPIIRADSSTDYPTFKCPKCNTEQREFFTVASARKNGDRSPAEYLVLYYFIYMIMSLFIFGMEEGWPALDCVYFSVTTLTTTGLGDYVPTADSAKIICSIFIYFGVNCIGLLMGCFLEMSLDDAAKKQAKENMIVNCPNCARLQESRQRSMRLSERSSTRGGLLSPQSRGLRRRTTSEASKTDETSPLVQPEQRDARGSSNLRTIDDRYHNGNRIQQETSPVTQSLGSSPGSAAPVETMGRQSHTRHFSIDSPGMKNIFDPGYTNANRRRNGNGVSNLAANSTYEDNFGGSTNLNRNDGFISDIDNDGNSQSSGWSALSGPTDDSDFFRPVSRIRAAKYVFLTLKQALANSLFVIIIGSFGFFYIEQLTAVDAFYFTMGLFTTVGYGDVVPRTPAGKVFATIYGILAVTALLYNISMISMIPLELRKRRIERAVLMQFGDELDDATLKELATGPLVRRLQIAGHSPEGLGQCTREMFSLAMLVRLGRITEQDVRSTFAAFKRLDKDNDGLLTSREIIMSAVDRKKKEQIALSVLETDSLLPHQRSKDMTRFMSAETMPLTRYRASQPIDYMSTDNGAKVQDYRYHRARKMSVESTYSALTYEEADDVQNWSQNNH